MSRTAIAAAITVMLYTRPAIVSAENIKLTPFRSGGVDGHYAIFAEEEAKERLESGFWVDHPNGLAKLDKAIAKAEGEDPADSGDDEAKPAPEAKPAEGEKVDTKAKVKK